MILVKLLKCYTFTWNTLSMKATHVKYTIYNIHEHDVQQLRKSPLVLRFALNINIRNHVNGEKYKKGRSHFG